MTDGTPPVPDSTLLALLANLLSKAGSNGELNSDAFWRFVAALAQGRGITAALHDAGLDAVAAAPASPAATRNFREARAYHIAVLNQFLMDAGGLAGCPSILPANFRHGVVASDLLAMLGGVGGMGEAEPQILKSARGGSANLRRYARQRIVGTVLWRAARTGASRAAIWDALMPPDVDGATPDKTVLDKWLAECGGAKGELACTARAAGAAGDMASPYAATDDELAPVIKLARTAQGRGARRG